MITRVVAKHPLPANFTAEKKLIAGWILAGDHSVKGQQTVFRLLTYNHAISEPSK